MTFSPIAIVGRACELPGASTPDALFQAVLESRDLTTDVPADRWGVAPRHAVGAVGQSADRTWSTRGGYVRGFEERFDASGFEVPATLLQRLDPVFTWLLHVAKQENSKAAMIGSSNEHAEEARNVEQPVIPLPVTVLL